MKGMIERPKLGKKVCAYVGRKAMMADHFSLFTEPFTFHISGRSGIGKKGSRLPVRHGLMSETGRASCTAALRQFLHRVKDSKERANEGARSPISRLQQVKGQKCCQIGLEVCG